jgi:hypothetical protein
MEDGDGINRRVSSFHSPSAILVHEPAAAATKPMLDNALNQE